MPPVDGTEQDKRVRDPFDAHSEEAANFRATKWAASVDPSAKVGSKHHIVPRTYLQRFSKDEVLCVRDRTTGVLSRRNIDSLAIRDFYTFVNVEGHLDGSFEELLSVIEGEAASVLKVHLDLGSFSRPRPLEPTERLRLDTFVAAQFVRGMKARRQLELLADYNIKLLNRPRLTQEQMDELEFVPHQNEHLRWMDEGMRQAYEYLQDRPTALVELHAPLLITGDEPVVLPKADNYRAPSTNGYPADGPPGIDPKDLIQLHSRGGVGLANSEEVILPLSPTRALYYGARQDRSLAHHIPLVGTESRRFANQVNAEILDKAVDWVAAHPDHPTFTAMKMPPPSPLLTVVDGGSPISKRISEADRRRPRRLRRESIVEPPL